MSAKDQDAMDVDVERPEDVDLEVDEDVDEFNDNEDGAVNEMGAPAGSQQQQQEQQQQQDKTQKKKKPAATVEPLIPELPEYTRKDKTLKEVLSMMDDYSPVIPDAVTDYLMAKNGLQINDLNIKRLLALATQKFISDIAQDAYEYSRIRSNAVNKLKNTLNSGNSGPGPAPAAAQGQGAGASGAGAGGSGSGGAAGAGGAGSNASGGSAAPTNEKLALTVEDLSSALEEHGVNIRRPNFYR